MPTKTTQSSDTQLTSYTAGQKPEASAPVCLAQINRRVKAGAVPSFCILNDQVDSFVVLPVRSSCDEKSGQLPCSVPGRHPASRVEASPVQGLKARRAVVTTAKRPVCSSVGRKAKVADLGEIGDFLSQRGNRAIRGGEKLAPRQHY